MNVDRQMIRLERQNRGWTQQQLADVSALSLRTVQRVENQGQASHETVAALCSVLEIDRERLLAPSRALEQDARRWPLLVLLLLAAFAGACIGALGTVALLS